MNGTLLTRTDSIKVKGRPGTFRVLECGWVRPTWTNTHRPLVPAYLVESEVYPDLVPLAIIDARGNTLYPFAEGWVDIIIMGHEVVLQ